MTSYISKNKRTFRDVWCFLSEQIGECRLLVKRNANNLNAFLKAQENNPGFMRQLITETYKRNQCANLDSSISIEIMFDVLGEKAAELKQTQKDDLADIELLEEIGWHLQQRYPFKKPSKNKPENQSAKVICLSTIKTRIQNSR